VTCYDLHVIAIGYGLLLSLSLAALRRMVKSRERGQQITEFAVALAILCVFFIPLVDLGIVPIRYFIAQATVESFARKLALTENITQAFKLLDDPELSGSLAQIGGMQVKSKGLALHAVSHKDAGKTFKMDKPKSMPEVWLPAGSNCPCQYMLVLSVQADIWPLVSFGIGGKKIPGLNAPFEVSIDMPVNWENLSRNPVTGGYFLNE
jgi:hypothetical protein